MGRRGILIALSTCSVLTLASARAFAADAEAPEVAEILVTGTRLPKPGLAADSPVTSLDRRQLDETATLTLETALNRLPQVTPSFSSASNNPSRNGAANVDLRGLGAGRNLVLVDGRRFVGGDAANAVDLNAIPTALIDHVEVLTGGGSAVYGPDAVAGVVNIILKPNFAGWRFDARTLISQRGDGQERQASLTYGLSPARGQLTLHVGWAGRDEIGKGERGFSSQAASPSRYSPGGGYFPGANTPTAASINGLFAGYGVAAGSVAAAGGVAGFGFNSDGTLFATGFPGSPLDAQNYRGPTADLVASFYPDVYAYNYEPFNKLVLPLERWTGAALGRFALTDKVELFGQVFATRYNAETSLAPSPALTDPNPLYPGQGVTAFTIPVTNPFIPTDLARLLSSRTGDSPVLAGSGANEEFLYRFRSTALGARRSQNRAEILQGVAGVRAELPGRWRAEASLDAGRYDRQETQDGLLSVTRMEQLLDSPSGGKDLCAGGFNPFGVVLGPECEAFLSVRARNATKVEQSVANVTASGPLGRLPAGDVSLAVGLEQRRVRFDFAPPDNLTPGEVAGYAAQDPLSGRNRFTDAYVEVAVPLVETARLAVGYRRSAERGGKASDSYKAEGGWDVTRGFRLRASAQRAVRAPDIQQRFEPPHEDIANAADPCAVGPSRTAQILALCQAQAATLGFPADYLDSFEQPDLGVSVVARGNPDLAAERATTFTLGGVWRQTWDRAWLTRLEASVDGYAINIDGAIAYRDPSVVLADCYNLSGANPHYDPAAASCQALPRSAADFTLFDIDAPAVNQVSLATSGVDLSLSTRTELGSALGRPSLGRVDLRLTASWLAHHREHVSSAQPDIDYAGTIAGAFTPYKTLPRWKAEGQATWSSGRLELSLLGRFIDKMEHRDHRVDPDVAASGVGAVSYWDLAGRWRLNQTVDLQAGVLNLFDRGPEIYAPAVDANTEPSTYDVVGRRYWLAISVRL